MKKLFLTLLIAVAGLAFADDFDDGVAAYGKENYEQAAAKFRLAAAQGRADAQFAIGSMYSNGQGVAQDYAEALRWYRLAAAQGLAEAQNNLGFMYGNGRGVAQDYVRAHLWYNLAAVGDVPLVVEG